MDNRYAKRKARRRAIKSITRKIILIRDIEEDYLNSLPDTEANEDRYIESEYFVGTLYNVVESLEFLQ